MRQSLFFCLFLFAVVSARAADPMGVDVYEGTGTINWSSAYAAGVTFAFTKGTQGNYYEDPNMASNMTGGKAAGLLMGVYDFADTTNNTPSVEANYFWNYVKGYVKADGKSLMPVLDFEPNTIHETTYKGASSFSDWANQWCNDVVTNAAASGLSVTPIIYISAGWTSTYMSSANAWTGAWIADYNGYTPQTGSPWSGGSYYQPWGTGVWNFWQYTSSGSVSGISGACDEDYFNGTYAQLLQNFVVGSTNRPNITQNPANVTTQVGSNITFSAQSSGTGPLTFRWYFGGRIIPGATSSNYTIAHIQLTNAGSYYMSASNAFGFVQTTPAYVWVLGPMTNAAGSVLAPANLVSWWTGDSNTIDIYGNNNAIPSGAMYYTTGEVGSAFHFDGSSSYLTPTTTSTLATPWTLCVWVNRQNAPGTSASIMGDSTYAVKLEQYNATREVGITKSGVADYVFHCSLPQNVWTHLGVVNSGSTISVYSNGVFVTSQLYSNGVVITPPSLPLPRGCIGGDLIGNGNLTDPMLGSLDEIQIFNRALSSTEIHNIYSAGTAGLVRAPQFTSVLTPSSTQVQLQLRGITGKSFGIETSPDLITWSLLGTVANPSGSTTYTSSITNGQQFYRVSQ